MSSVSTSFKVEKDKRLIQNIFNKYIENNIELFLVTEKGIKISLTIEELLDDQNFAVKVYNEDDKALLKENRLYSIASYTEGAVHNFIVKCNDGGPYLISFNYPSELTIIDKRNFTRYEVGELSNPYIQINSQGNESVFVICDISQGGLAFIVPSIYSEQFQVKDYIHIKKIGKKKVSPGIKAEIMHLSPLHENHETFIKVGVSFKELSSILKK